MSIFDNENFDPIVSLIMFHLKTILSILGLILIIILLIRLTMWLLNCNLNEKFQKQKPDPIEKSASLKRLDSPSFGAVSNETIETKEIFNAKKELQNESLLEMQIDKIAKENSYTQPENDRKEKKEPKYAEIIRVKKSSPNYHSNDPALSKKCDSIIENNKEQQNIVVLEIDDENKNRIEEYDPIESLCSEITADILLANDSRDSLPDVRDDDYLDPNESTRIDLSDGEIIEMNISNVKNNENFNKTMDKIEQWIESKIRTVSNNSDESYRIESEKELTETLDQITDHRDLQQTNGNDLIRRESSSNSDIDANITVSSSLKNEMNLLSMDKKYNETSGCTLIDCDSETVSKLNDSNPKQNELEEDRYRDTIDEELNSFYSLSTPSTSSKPLIIGYDVKNELKLIKSTLVRERIELFEKKSSKLSEIDVLMIDKRKHNPKHRFEEIEEHLRTNTEVCLSAEKENVDEKIGKISEPLATSNSTTITKENSIGSNIQEDVFAKVIQQIKLRQCTISVMDQNVDADNESNQMD
ncbi:ADP-ribosylation factor-like protein 6 [Sarcoptes scabiei]|nr:ADP-ribosylation factor-like protein 6 [Sarcoptes scabiei]